MHPETLVVNDPTAVRNAPESFPSVLRAVAETLITRDIAALKTFRADGNIILKPVFGNGGAGIFRVGHGDENFGALIDIFCNQTVNSYRPALSAEVRAGDKRVILVEGEAVGALNRVPAAGDARANVCGRHAGSRHRSRFGIVAEMGPHCAIWALCLPVVLSAAFDDHSNDLADMHSRDSRFWRPDIAA